MRKTLALILVVGAALLVGGVADATDGSGGDPAGATRGVRYDWAGPDGEMSIVGEAGMPFVAFDCGGNPVADGVLNDTLSHFMVGNSGVGPDGVVLHVMVGDQVLSVTDPDWEWN